MFSVPDSQLGVLGDVSALNVVELGCGTTSFSARLARRWPAEENWVARKR